MSMALTILGNRRKMQVRHKDQTEQFRQKLMSLSAKLGGVFIHYDGEVWIMKTEKF